MREIMEKISELVEALIQFLNKQTSIPQQHCLLTTTEIISIVIAILSFLGMIGTTIFTIWQNFKLRNTSARIEWIQKVRDTTAEIISTYSSALNEDDIDKVQKAIIEVREKVERLILFFGHESIANNKTDDILDKETNNGKNDLIVRFLIELSNDFVTYYKNVSSKVLLQAERRLDSVSRRLQDNITGIESYEEIKIEEKSHTNIEYKYNPEDEKEYEEAQTKVAEMRRFNEELNKKLEKLRDIMRIYLKIEWNKAKKGK